MNRILKVILITSAVMLLVLGGTGFLLFRTGKSANEARRENETREMDMLYEGGEKVDLGKQETQIHLDTKGKDALLKTFTYQNVAEIYDLETSAAHAEKIADWKKKGKFSIVNPLAVWNPYGTDSCSMYLYFPTNERSKLRYTVSVEDETIPDFSRTLKTDTTSGLTREHAYLLVGFVPGMKNYLVLEQLDQGGDVIAKQVFYLDVPKLKSGAEVRIAATQGKSRKEMTNGLFYLCGVEDKNGNLLPYIWLYDNSGILRGEIPIKNYRTDRICFIGGNMVYSYGKSQFAKVSRFGQVLSVYDIGRYEQHHDFIYNDYGSLWILATDTKKKSGRVGDVLVSLNLTTGDTVQLLDFEKLLKQQAKKQTGRNWISLNSLQRIGSTSVLVSSDSLSTLFKVSGITSSVPVVSYLIADVGLWKRAKLGKKLLSMKDLEASKEKEGEDEKDGNSSGESAEAAPAQTDSFLPQYGQHHISCEEAAVFGEQKTEENSVGTADVDTSYYVSMFNNNFKGKRKGGASYYYRYLVNEAEGTYVLTDKFELPYSKKNGSVQRYKGQYVCGVSEAAKYVEYDAEGVIVYQYALKNRKRFYRVQKEDMKGFWFQ